MWYISLILMRLYSIIQPMASVRGTLYGSNIRECRMYFTTPLQRLLFKLSLKCDFNRYTIHSYAYTL